MDKGRWGSLEPLASSNRSHGECPSPEWSAWATPHGTPGPRHRSLQGGSCTHCQERWRGQWPPDKGSGPAHLVGVDISMAAGGGTQQAKWVLQRPEIGSPDLGGVTKATPTFGDTVGLVAELAWLGLRPPWAGQAGQRAIVLWLEAASCMAASHRLPQGLCALRAQPWPRGQANGGGQLPARTVLEQGESSGASSLSRSTWHAPGSEGTGSESPALVET